MKRIERNLILFILSISFLIAAPGGTVFSDTINELRSKIADKESAIKALEAEIASTQREIDKNLGQQKTLANTIKAYDSERKKLLKEIQVTTQKIEQKRLEIESLALSIDEKGRTIESDASGLAELMRRRDSLEGQTTFVAFLNNLSMAQYWDSLRQNEVLTAAIGNRLIDLKTAKTDLQSDKNVAEAKRRDLSDLNKQLSGGKQAAEAALSEKQKLLKDTKNKESEYQKLLKKKLSDKNEFEKELLDFESALNFAIDPNSIPAVGSGVLRWPLGSIRITQTFGNTEFAAAHRQLYNGNGHNGVDFAASVGTPVKSAQSGTVKGTGNTDTACPGASYGKWVLVEHFNGLSTLYAHLSVISVKAGELVAAGDTIGLSGNTGYTTGPHLHFTVYATQGVRIMSRQSKVCSGTYIMPVADFKAYLNPLSYL
ncbi:MAG: peptidoglycan DD-metalloendopeptidase family protein [Candidatus Taylorbacteria bacterium]|nr:peptidoglycan DD-metalloendopeptidase family protein [Candidatus Taylorbacteria bacterium]